MKCLLGVFVCLLALVSALDLTGLKLTFCDKLRGHWAYDRLNLKYNCLGMVKELGTKLCLDVIKIYLCLHLNLYCKRKCKKTFPSV